MLQESDLGGLGNHTLEAPAYSLTLSLQMKLPSSSLLLPPPTASLPKEAELAGDSLSRKGK